MDAIRILSALLFLSVLYYYYCARKKKDICRTEAELTLYGSLRVSEFKKKVQPPLLLMAIHRCPGTMGEGCQDLIYTTN